MKGKAIVDDTISLFAERYPVNGVATDYTLHGKLVTGLKQGTNKLHFFYDAQSRPAMVDFNGVMYSYVHNLQGDIVGILDNTGALVVEYQYDAWGKPIGAPRTLTTAYVSLAALNPFRYRGYVWDEETGLYYLRSRYYNPEWGRFVNADVLSISTQLLNENLFCYAKDSPISEVDSNGKESMPYTLTLNVYYKIVDGFIDKSSLGHYDVTLNHALTISYGSNENEGMPFKEASTKQGVVTFRNANDPGRFAGYNILRIETKISRDEYDEIFDALGELKDKEEDVQNGLNNNKHLKVTKTGYSKYSAEKYNCAKFIAALFTRLDSSNALRKLYCGFVGEKANYKKYTTWRFLKEYESSQNK